MNLFERPVVLVDGVQVFPPKTLARVADSRKRLETDILHDSEVAFDLAGEKTVKTRYTDVLEWLDRQANITAYDSGRWRLKYMDLLDERRELENEINKLQRKVDELELRERCASDYDFRQAAERWEQAFEDKCAELHLLQEKVDELTAERDEWVSNAEVGFRRIKELEAERDEAVEAYDAHMAAHDAWHEAEEITYTRNRFSMLEQAKNEHIEKLTAERDTLQTRYDALMKRRGKALPEGVEWPRFEDGSSVWIGDETEGGKVKSITFRPHDIVFQFPGIRFWSYEYGEKVVKRDVAS